MKIIMFYFSKGTLYCLWTLTRGRNAFWLLEKRRFLTLGVDTEIVTRFITRNAFKRKDIGTMRHHGCRDISREIPSSSRRAAACVG